MPKKEVKKVKPAKTKKSVKTVKPSGPVCIPAKGKKPVIGFFSFSCCEGCIFTVLFIDKILDVLNDFNVQYFHLIKEKNREVCFDIAFVEGAVTSKDQAEKIKKIREKSKLVVAIGACACHGGVPSMRNFIEEKELGKYVYNQGMLKDTVRAAGIGEFVQVDYYMYGCPMIKSEFIEFLQNYLKQKQTKVFEGPVCDECPRRGKNCYLREKRVCLGAVTRGGCKAICIKENIPCVLCRGPIQEKEKLPAEIKLFKSWGLSEKDIFNKVRKFKNIEL